MTHHPNSSSATAEQEGRTLDVRAPWRTHRFVVVDVEGNGQRPPDLVELAAVPIEAGRIGDPRAWLVRPHRPISAMSRRFHKISDADVADKPSVSQVAHEMCAELAGAVLVAHNAPVDLGVIGRELGHTPAQVIDTLKLARRFLPGESSYKLGALVERLDLEGQAGGPPGMTAHRAAYDALMCARLLVVLADAAPNLTLFDLLDKPPGDGSDAPSLF
jgi:exodeoxyribonuclease X